MILALSVSWILCIVMQFFNVPFPLIWWWINFGLSFLGFLYVCFQRGLGLYLFKRTIGALVAIAVIATITFLLLRIIPGGPFDTDKALPPEIKASIESHYHLDLPIYKQYLIYITGLLHGDLGESYKYIGRNVSEIIAETLPISLELGIYSLLLSFSIGIPLGLLAAAKHNTFTDHLLMTFAICGVSLPSFLVAPLLILFFCFFLHWFEPALWEGPTSYVLPVVVLATRSMALVARLTRSTVLDVIRADYIRTARSKGLSEFQILFKHVLKNSILPVLTYSGPLAAEILSGAFVVEQIFAIPGLGKHMVLSVSNRDYPMVLATTLLFSVMLITANLIVDLLYSYFDPRIELQ